MVPTLPLSASTRRTASVGVPRSTATSKRPQHGGKPLAQLVGDAIDQEGFGAERPRTLLPPAQQRAVEDGGDGRHLIHLQHERACLGKPGRRRRSCRSRGQRYALRFGLSSTSPCRRCAHPAASRWATASGFCAGCWSKLSFIEPPYCARLGIPFGYDPGPGLLSMEAIADPPAYDRARAAVRYDDIARALVLTFKYGDRLDLAPMMGRWMARAGGELLGDADALVPVPLHWRRLWARRFNQSAALARADLGHCGVPVVDDALKRVRATPQQVGLSKTERAGNLQGAFRVPAGQKFNICRKAGGAGRRRAHVRRHRRYLRPRLAARRCRPCRCAGFRPGCRHPAQPHINVAGGCERTVHARG